MNSNILSLDIGDKRIGVAIADAQVRIAQPLTTILRDNGINEAIKELIASNNVTEIVIGLPRNMQGEETKQTKEVYDFVESLKQDIISPIHMQDESLTSVNAEKELKLRGKPYDKGAIDALAACYILEDFLSQGVKHAQA